MPQRPRPPAVFPSGKPGRAPHPGPGLRSGPDVLVAVTGRSEALALAPVARALRAGARIGLKVLTLARGAQDLPGTLALFGLSSDLDLGRRRARDALLSTAPDWVLVEGASPGTHAVARLARRAGVAVAHLGAGLRPAAEGPARCEAQRHRALTQLACLHLAPDEPARRALLDEGVRSSAVHVVGDPGAEALAELHERVRVLGASDLATEAGALLAGLLESWQGRLVLVSVRRRGVLDEVCDAVRAAAARHPDWLFAWPVHGSARVQARVHARTAGVANVVQCEALNAAAFAWLLGRCDAVLTDSIALQGQGAALGRPVLVARPGVERAGLAATGLVRPVGTRTLGVLAGLERLLLDPALLATLPRRALPDGGHAAEAAAAALLRVALAQGRGREVVA